MAMSTRTPSSPLRRSTQGPSTGIWPSTARPRVVKKAMAAGRSSTITLTWSIRLIVMSRVPGGSGGADERRVLRMVAHVIGDERAAGNDAEPVRARELQPEAGQRFPQPTSPKRLRHLGVDQDELVAAALVVEEPDLVADHRLEAVARRGVDDGDVAPGFLVAMVRHRVAAATFGVAASAASTGGSRS